ncbi:MAG TPA: N-acetyltransferase, partial [Bacteroidales bacterium]|nr:N-acetyltransferase [Bacteroidales bacterium]
KDVAPYELVVGNPARHSGWMSEFGHRLHFNPEGIAECPESKVKYRLINNSVTKI